MSDARHGDVECLRVVILNLDNLFPDIFQKLCFTSLVGLETL